MAVWVVKGGRSGEREQRMLDHGCVAIGWEELGDLSEHPDRDSLSMRYRATYPDAPEGRVPNHVGQLFRFANETKVGDLVVVPLKTSSSIAVGEITGPYQFKEDLGPDMSHRLPVKWLRTDIPRSTVDQDLRHTLGTLLTVSRAERNNAERRIRKMVTDQGNDTSAAVSPLSTPDQLGDALQDIEEQARDQILSHMSRKYRGHDLARLVDAVLVARGYFTRRMPPGPDGGADILAGSGTMGFDAPRLCVQVKSSDSPADVKVYRELKGTMQSFNADQGLLISWGGFKDTVRRETATGFFRVRLWDAGDLLNAVLARYDQMPEEIRAELPLKRIWTLTLAEGDV
jgi:restriction system protein